GARRGHIPRPGGLDAHVDPERGAHGQVLERPNDSPVRRGDLGRHARARLNEAKRRGLPVLLRQAYRYFVGHMMVRHMWAAGLASKPRPSLGCLKFRPTTSVNSSSCTCTLGSNE